MTDINKDAPSDIKAPIVLEARGRQGLELFMRYLEALKGSEGIARQEGERLSPYFNRMSDYVGSLIQTLDEDTSLGRQKDQLQKTSSPGGLKKLFNDMAAHTGNTLLSGVVILPDNIRETGPAKTLFDQPHFKTSYYYGGYTFNFGFLQIYKTDDKGIKTGSVTFPTFMIDHRMIEAIAGHGPERLLQGLQDMMTHSNHDMLHHFTMPELNRYNPEVAGRFEGQDDQKPSPYDWVSVIGYEPWAHKAHESILTATEGPADTKKLQEGIDDYFDQLEGIRDKMLSEGRGHLLPLRRKVHEVVDYYGVLMANALIRAFPLDHPLVGHCLDRMQKADPMPEEALFDCARCAPSEPGSDELPGPLPRRYRRRPALVLDMLRREILEAPPEGIDMPGLIHGVIARYREGGFDILPKEDAAVGYKNFKLIQLIYTAHSDIEAHLPDHPQSDRKARADEATLRMLLAGRQYTQGLKN